MAVKGILQEFNFQFMTPRRIRIAAMVTTALLLISIASLAIRGLSFGIDFTGGTLVEVGYSERADRDQVLKLLHEGGYTDATAQYFGSDRYIAIRLGIHEQAKDKLSSEILELLRSDGSELEMRRVEFVGPQVGKELIEDGGLAILYTLIGILIYVSLRFEKRFALGSVLALMHDTLITLGFFSLFQLEFDLTTLAAILAVIGYSLNDTIVVFDRIRENFLKLRKRKPAEVMNSSINQTLLRTIITSLTTLLVVLVLLFFGGKLIFGFAAALTVGIIVGTYSSIYVASSVTLAMGVSKADLMPVEKEGEQQDNIDP